MVDFVSINYIDTSDHTTLSAVKEVICLNDSDTEDRNDNCNTSFSALASIAGQDGAHHVNKRVRPDVKREGLDLESSTKPSKAPKLSPQWDVVLPTTVVSRHIERDDSINEFLQSTGDDKDDALFWIHIEFNDHRKKFSVPIMKQLAADVKAFHASTVRAEPNSCYIIFSYENRERAERCHQAMESVWVRSEYNWSTVSIFG